MKIFVPILLFISIAMAGCGIKSPPEDDFIATLADTILAGEECEFILTTGTGAWYYADVLGLPRRGIYGFYLAEEKIFDEWQLLGTDGEVICKDIEYSIVHPEYCLRHYTGGITERLECLPGNDALAVTYSFPAPRKTKLTVFSRAVVVANSIDKGYFNYQKPPVTNVTASEKATIVAGIFTKKSHYSQSKRMGESGSQILTADKEYTFPSCSELTFVITAAPDSGSTASSDQDPIRNLARSRLERRKRSQAALSRFTFRCDDKAVEKAYAWARLTLAGMYFERNGESHLFAGIPADPYVNSFHTSIAAMGYLLTDATRSRSVRLFETILAKQNPPDDPEAPSYLPTEIHDKLNNYSSGIAAGAIALAFDRVVASSDSVPLGVPFKFLQALDRYIGAEINSNRNVFGLITGPGLFPNIGFPPRPRQGALFETQALFAEARVYLATHRSVNFAELEVPDEALRGSSELSYPFYHAIAVGLNFKQFRMPLSIERMKICYFNKNTEGYDRLLIPEFADKELQTPQMISNTPYDSTRSVVPMLSIAWLDNGDQRRAAQLLTIAERDGLLALNGFRSLSSLEGDFQSSHVYVYDDKPINAAMSGDVLVWTAGILADLYTLSGRYEEAADLFETLSRSVMEEGVIGGLPETTNGISVEYADNTGRNPVFSSSLAEYIRILYDDILGIQTKRPTLPGVRLTVPKEWGSVEFSFETAGSIITLKRLDSETWTAWQDGSKDAITLTVEYWPEPGVRGYGSVRLNPKYLAKFKVIPTSVGRYTLAWDEFAREQ